MLIDTGDWRDDGEQVLQYLRDRGIERLDYLVSTHADADHIGGHEAVIEHFETEADGIGAIYDPGIAAGSLTYDEYLDAVEAYDVTLYETRAGDTIPFEGSNLQVLSPPETYLANGDRNENSIVLRLAFGESSFMLPGDTAESGEEYLVSEYGSAVNVTVLQAGHHGSDSSTSEAFLDATTPKVSVISSGYDSQYGHPDPAVLERLAAHSVTSYWTGTHGDVVMRSNGTSITVATQRSAPTSPTKLRDGSAVTPTLNDPVQVRTVFDVSGEPTPIATDGGTETPMPMSPETPTPTPTQTPSPTPTPSSSEGGALTIVRIHEDASGDEYDNLNDEYLVFENVGDQRMDLSAWTVSDVADHTYTFPAGTTLDPGAQMTLRTGSGQDTATDRYWGSEQPVWNNGGDTVFVRDDSGELVIQEEYS